MKKLTLILMFVGGVFIWIVAPRGLRFPWPSPMDIADSTVPDDGEPFELGVTYAGEVGPE